MRWILTLGLLVGSLQAQQDPRDAYKGVKAPYLGRTLIWNEKEQGYVPVVKNREGSLRWRTVSGRDLSDEELREELGIDAKTGEVSNEASTDYEFEIGTWFGYVFDLNKVKVGPYLTAYRFNDSSKLTLDGADSFIGASLRYDFTSLLRPSMGIGLGTPLDGSWYWTVSGSARLW